MVRSQRRLLEREVALRTAEVRRQKTRIERQNEELQAFAYAVSHDLKSPLVTLRGFLGLIERDLENGRRERVLDHFDQIKKATDRMRELLDGVLSISRTGQLELDLAPLEPSEVAREVVELLGATITAECAVIEIADDLPTVSADRGQLVELLQNLVENAIKFRRPEATPRVWIGCERGDARPPVFFVRDNGVGIAPKDLPGVFGLFRRLDATVSGSGLGLALARRIVDRHGGRIWAESDGPGQGATFRFTLPPP